MELLRLIILQWEYFTSYKPRTSLILQHIYILIPRYHIPPRLWCVMCKVLSWNKISEVQILMILITNHYFCLKMFLLFEFQWQWMSKKCVNFISATFIFHNNSDTIFQFFRHHTLKSSWYCDVKPTRYVRLKMSIFRSCTPRPWCPMSPSPLSDWCHAWSPPRTTTSAPVSRSHQTRRVSDVSWCSGWRAQYLEKAPNCYLCLLHYSTYLLSANI